MTPPSQAPHRPKPGTDDAVTRDQGPHADVIMFVEKSRWNEPVAQHAQRVANALGGHIVLLHVLVPPHGEATPIDPVDWDIKKQQTRNWLSGIARAFDVSGHKTESVLLEGQTIGQISAHMARRKGAIAAAVRPSFLQDDRHSDAVSGVLASDSNAILIIPSTSTPPKEVGYRKVLLPLDGSARAESALHTAASLARAEDAELVLCYVPPQPGVSEFGIVDTEAAQLSKRVQNRNALAGQSHLTDVKNRLAHLRLKVSTLVVIGDDVRRALIDTAVSQVADIIVMATHGQSGHRDVPAGSVASHVLDRSDIPVLMVRCDLQPQKGHATNGVASEGIRYPACTNR